MHPLRGGRPGFSLIELLLVIAIIGILAGLLVGPAFHAYRKARDTAWNQTATEQFRRIEERLHDYHLRRGSYPAETPEQLHARRVFDGAMVDFTKSPRVSYTPFASSDPDDKVILEVELGSEDFLGDPRQQRTLILRKGRVTRQPE